MRNRFKPCLSNSRTSRSSTSSQNVNAGGNVSSGNSTENTQLQEPTPRENEDKTSETKESHAAKEQGQDKEAELKTASVSDTPALELSRRPRIKPTVVPVARGRRNVGNKDKVTLGQAKDVLKGTKETNSSGSQAHTISNTDNQLSTNEPQEKQAPGTTEEVLKSPSLKERNQQANGLIQCPTVGRSPVTNAEQQLPSVIPDPVIKPSQTQNKSINSDSVIANTNDSGAAPSLLRRKRVLPNLGSASRRRHSSVSKENVERNLEVPEVSYDETVTTEHGLGHSSEQSSVENSGSKNKRSRTLSEGEKTTDHVISPAATSETHGKEDNDEEEDNGKRKGVKRKRGSRPCKLKEPLDPSQMTMQHLIYFNPKTNPMTSGASEKKKKGGRKKNKKGNEDKELEQESDVVNNPSSVSGSPARTDIAQNSKEASVDEDDTDGASVAPRVKLDADGNIILDEESLVIPKSPEKNLDDSEIVYEDADEVNFTAYLRQRKVGRWSLEETQRFYKALSQVGTDFSLMLPLFPSRIRRELKAKFKREEKLHRSLVEKALRFPRLTQSLSSRPKKLRTLGVRNPIEVELFTPKVDGEEIDDDVSCSGDNSSSQRT